MECWELYKTKTKKLLTCVWPKPWRPRNQNEGDASLPRCFVLQQKGADSALCRPPHQAIFQQRTGSPEQPLPSSCLVVHSLSGPGWARWQWWCWRPVHPVSFAATQQLTPSHEKYIACNETWEMVILLIKCWSGTKINDCQNTWQPRV